MTGQGMTHIRHKALPRGYRVTRDTYWNERPSDPQGQTLCGAQSTTQDMSWAETRYPKSRAWVTCAECVSIRVSDSKAVA